MVAQFLGLKLRLLANLFRRSPWQIVGIVVGLLYGLVISVGLAAVLIGLRLVGDIDLLGNGMIVGGSLVVLGFFLLPLVFGVDDSMDPRSFSLMAIPNRTLAFGLAVSSLIGIPAIALAIVLLGTVVTWSRGIVVTILAVIAAVLLLATCMLASRVSTSLAAFLLATRRSREFTGVAGLLLLLVLSPAVILVLTLDWARYGLGLLEALATILAWTPLGAAWAVPADAATGDWGLAMLRLVIASGTVYLLWLAWQGLVGRMLVTPEREAHVKQYGGLGWFDRMPGNTVGAVAARSLTYWSRDARYWVSFIMIPVVPILAILPLSIAGVPSDVLALLPVPLMCVFLGWTMHNDVAYDNTAIWLHIASGTKGVSDRIGRAIPALLVGIPLIAIGSVLSIYFYGNWSALPSMLGVSTCILLSGLGFSSYTSARFPYPVAKPGDSPFAQPQSSDTASALIQSVSFIGSVVFSLPAIAFAALGLFVDPIWNMPALYVGVGVGILALTGGIWLGSVTFERRGPEMLASALRA